MSSITDVGGILVGHYHRLDPDATMGAGWASGVTVVLTPPGTVGAVDCRGGAPGSRETDLLDPSNSVRHVDAVLIAGGSAYGLAAADGIMRWLEEHDRGVAMAGGMVPIVPGAVIFDLDVGAWSHRPTAEFGYNACQAAFAAVAEGAPVAVGTVGAGVGACAGVLKGGVGTASTTLPSGVTVGALVAVNSAGNVIDQATGLPWLTYLVDELGLTPPPPEQIAELAKLESPLSSLNTAVAVVATDAVLSPAACRQIASTAHDGLARSIRPSHTPVDGDIVFALATGAVEVAPSVDTPAAFSPETPLATAVGAAAADCLARAVLVGVIAAESVAGIPTYRDLLPGAFLRRAGDDAERSDAEERRKIPAGDDAERSDAEERRKIPAGDDAERSDAEERRKIPAGDDAERSDAEERRKIPAGDDAERSDAEERRKIPAGDDAERSDAEERRKIPAGDDAERSDAEERRKIPAGDDAERSDAEERR